MMQLTDRMQILKHHLANFDYLVFLNVVLSTTATNGAHTGSLQTLRYSSRASPAFHDGGSKNDTSSFSIQLSASDAVWVKAICKGQKIFQALITDADKARRFITPVISLWYGPLLNEFRAWGYNDISHEKNHACRFHPYLGSAFAALGIDTKSAGEGGPNRCFAIEHRNGPTVIKDSFGRVPPPWQQFYIGPDGLRYQLYKAILRAS